jgi:serine/threonine protein kinase
MASNDIDVNKCIETVSKPDMMIMYESFINIACTLLFSFCGLRLYKYLHTANKAPSSISILRVTRYHSENSIKYSNFDPLTQHEKRVCFDFVNTLAFLFILKKHALICKTIKIYDHREKTGVFMFEDKFIIKYAEFSDMRESKIYNDIPCRGINKSCKIITPIWYSFFENKEYKNRYSECHTDSASEPSEFEVKPSSRSKSVLTLYDVFDKINIIVARKDIMCIEVQPVLNHSVVFHKWYTAAQFNPKNHDYVIGSMMLSLARSIKYCHDVGLVHGDIKPDNLLITYEPPEKPKEEEEKPKEEEDGEDGEGEDGEDGENVDDDFTKWRRFLKVDITGKTRNPCDIPSIYLIDFGMCGYHEKDEGTGGTRPFCAPETKNIKIIPDPSKSKSSSKSNPESEYNWCSLNKQHDIWSWGLILYTVTAYHDIYNTYDEYPSDTFESDGYINEYQQEYASEIKSHPFYPIFKKTLCDPSTRTSSIDEIIHDMELILKTQLS